MIIVGGLLLVVGATLALRHRGSDRQPSVAILRAIRQASPAQQRDWIDAMLAEWAAIGDRRSARRFARGCLKAFLLAPKAADSTARAIRAALGGATGCAVGLAAFGIVAYPDVRPDMRTAWMWSLYLVVFLATIAVLTVVGLALANLGTARTRRVGLLAGTSAGLFAWWAAWSDTVLSSLLVIVVALPLVVVVILIARHTGRRDEAAIATGLMAIIAALLVFVADATTAYATGGGTPTPDLLHQFAHSGAHNYAGWAISENLGGAVFLVCSLPIIITMLGAVAARLVAK